MTKVLHLVPPGKLRCYVTGKLRADKPEEHVRQRWARSLVEEYGYPKADIGVEVTIAMGRARKLADLAVFRHGKKHCQEEALILVEAKRDDVKPSDGKKGAGQLVSYMAASPVCRWGLWVGQERQAFERQPDTGEVDRTGDIPRFGEDEPAPPTRADLVAAHDLSSVFRRCHNYIYANSGLQKAEAFYEMLKLIFCKSFDEDEGADTLAFSIDARERTSESGLRRLMEDRLNPLFAQIRQRYPFIFRSDETIELEPKAAAYVVYEMQYLSLRDTNTDIKGAAYEELVGDNLRGDRGEYFTPRNVCDMAVQMVMALHPEESLSSLKVLDCCCGTGGFLVSWLNNLYGILLAQELRRGGGEEDARRRVRVACERNLYGLDINPHLVRTAQMNLVLHGDGSSNICRADTTRSPGEWDADPRRKIPYGRLDVVLTNPPFGGGGKIDDGHVLDQYELPRWGKGSRSALPAERLFVEVALRFVRPGGLLAIVLPDGILNNQDAKWLRHWLLHRSQVLASIDLPKTTFAASRGVNNPSVLIVRKFTRTQQKQADQNVVDTSYPVFMAAPRTSGIDKRANPLYLRHSDGQLRLDEDGKKLIDDQIGAVAHTFLEWLRG